MSTVDNHIDKYLTFFHHQKIDLKSKLLIACSGGSDSMALLDLSFRAGLNINVAHVNYQLRINENLKEVETIQNYCQERNINLHIKTTSISKIKNLQNEARIIRYEYFNEVKEKYQLDYIITGHQENDNHETFLFNALRGNGLNRLKGIREINDIVLRPLLNFSKTEVEKYLVENDVPFNLDSSNLKSKYDRNYLRNDLFSVIKNRFPNYEKGLTKTITFLNEDYHLLEYLVKEKLKQSVTVEKNYTKIQYDNKIPFHLWSHFLRNYGFHHQQIKKWIEDQPTTGKFIESSNYQLLSDRKFWILRNTDSESNYLEECDLEKNKSIRYPISLTGHLTKTINFEKFNSQVEYFNYSKLLFPLKIRKWIDGDKIQPLGMKGSKKVSDYLTDKKVSQIERRNTYVLISDEDIVWIIGHVINEKYKTPKNSKTSFKLVYKITN